MAAQGIPVRACKVYAAWIGEKAARLKLSACLLTRQQQQAPGPRTGFRGMSTGSYQGLASCVCSSHPGRTRDKAAVLALWEEGWRVRGWQHPGMARPRCG
jgi:hypothetical protein